MHKLEQIAERAAEWIGSTKSILVHTIGFGIIFLTYFFGIPFSTILLALTTVVSLEAIYLSIFVQMTVNKHSKKIHKINKDIEEMR